MGKSRHTLRRRRPWGRRRRPLTAGRAMRLGRIVVSALCTALLTALLTALGGWVEPVAGWLARIQFLPAAVAFTMTVFVGWVIATLIFGRVYCSTVCPLGFYQDVCARLGRGVRRRPYRWAPPFNPVRYTALAFAAVAMAFGAGVVVGLMDPYEEYAIMCRNVVKPLWEWVVDFWAYPPVRVAAASFSGVLSAAVIALTVGGVAAAKGRLWCNTFCPVGTALGLVARYSLLHFDIDTDTCTNCRLCEYACKAQCIDMADHVVDMSRCVVCFDCTDACPTGAIRYTLASHTLSLPMMERIGREPGRAAGLSMGAPGGTDKAAPAPQPSDTTE